MTDLHKFICNLILDLLILFHKSKHYVPQMFVTIITIFLSLLTMPGSQ